jgi:hypothetical protein
VFSASLYSVRTLLFEGLMPDAGHLGRRFSFYTSPVIHEKDKWGKEQLLSD